MTETQFKALVVEDDNAWQDILGEILLDAGLQVERTDSLAGSLELINASSHRLAVVDLSLGGGDHTNQDGLQVLDAIRMHDPGCAAILLTGYANVEIAVSAISEHNALTCLRKEAFNRRQFRQIVDRALTNAPPLGQPTDTVLEGEGVHSAVGGDSHTAKDMGASSDLALVVEDSAAWRETLTELLADAGFSVHASGSYAEALGRLRRESYRLAVIDLSLDSSLPPVSALWDTRGDGGGRVERDELDGFRLLASTRAGGIPTVVVSGVANPQDIERAYAEHAIFAFMPKQVFTRQAFLQTVRELFINGDTRRNSEMTALMDTLTEREQEVLALLAKGMTNKEIADTLFISTNTVKRHLKAVFDKLDVHTRSAAAAKAVGAGSSNSASSPEG